MFFDKVAARQQFKFFNTYRKSIMYNSQAAVTTTQFQSHYSTQSNTFDAQHFQQHLTTSAVGRYFMYRQVVDSTMNLAQQECSNGAPTGTLILAEEQTQGKGRMNREWSSAGKGNLYFTIIFRTKEFVDLCKLNLSIAMAVARACREEGVLDAGVKWPNDVWIKGKKVSGMLIDSSTTMGNNNSMFQACCGVGINVNENMQQNDKVAHLATSLHDTLGHSVCREILLARICNHLETLLSQSMHEVIKQFDLYDILKNQPIIVMPKKLEGGEKRNAKAVRLTPFGNLIVKYDDEETEHELTSEEVSIRPINMY